MMSLSVGAAITNTIDWVTCTKNIYFSVLKASKSKLKVPADLVSDADEHLLVSTHREREIVSPYKSTNPIHGVR